MLKISLDWSSLVKGEEDHGTAGAVAAVGAARRTRPKMVRQNHIDIDSDSSESKSHLLPWYSHTLAIQKNTNREKIPAEVS